MSKVPAVYKSTHRIKFSDLDPYKHMRTAMYSAYYVDHRMDALREQAGWDLPTLEQLPFMTFVKRLDIEFIRPVVGDKEIGIRQRIVAAPVLNSSHADGTGIPRHLSAGRSPNRGRRPPVLRVRPQ